MTQEEFISQILSDMQADGLPEAEQREMLEQLQGRFQEVVISVTLARLSSEQQEVVSKAVDQGEEVLEQVLTELTAQTPGLSEDIEKALAEEYRALKEAMA